MFAACVAPVYTWSILAFLEQVPGWLFYLNIWDVISIFAYTQAFAFLESAIVLLILILLGVILPARFLRDRFIAQGSIIVFLTVAWAVAIHYTGFFPFSKYAPWYSKRFIFGVVLYLVSIGISYVLISHHQRLEQAINSFIERLTVLLYIYVPITGLSAIVIALRNIKGMFE